MLMWWLFTMLFAFFPVLLLLGSSCFVAIVRIHSTTWVRLLHGLDILPSGISGKMTVTLDTTTIFAMLVVSILSLCRATYHLFIKPPILPCQASNPPFPSKPLFGYVTALLSPSYSFVSCRWRLKFVPCWNMEMLFLVGTCLLVGISQYLLFN